MSLTYMFLKFLLVPISNMLFSCFFQTFRSDGEIYVHLDPERGLDSAAGDVAAVPVDPLPLDL